MARPSVGLPDELLRDGGSGGNSYRQRLMQSDLEREESQRNERRNAAQFAIDRFGELIDAANAGLSQLLDENDSSERLGTAIVRGCQELADAAGSLASHIEHQSDDDRRALAQACIDDAQQTLLLAEESGGDSPGGAGGRGPGEIGAASSSNEQLVELSTELSQDQVASAIQAAGTLLRDVEATLRSIDRHEAEDIADAALTLAHLFVLSLQSVHASLTPDDLLSPSSTAAGATSQRGGLGAGESPTTTIELLDDDGNPKVGEEVDDGDDVFEKVRMGSSSRSHSAQGTGINGDRQGSGRKVEPNQKRRMERLRVLWPPLGPAVANACQWGQHAAAEKPLLAVSLGIVLWPAAVVTALVGAPIVLLDGMLQNLYKNFEQAPVVEGVERTAAQLYQTGRLSLLCGRLVARQALRVAQRQVDRRGGVGRIAGDVGSYFVDRAAHPVETAGMAWSGLTWGWGVAVDTWKQISDREREETAQRLQQ
jgi:hypothetical protein